jgi:hypothetical protein
MSSCGFRQKFGATPSGTVSGGAVAQLIGVGVVDMHLTGGKPDVSYFRSRIQKHNNFASEVVSESFMGNINWGCEASLTLNKTCDLVSDIFIVLDRPGIEGVAENSGSSRNPYSSSSRPSRASRRYKYKCKQATRHVAYPTRTNGARSFADDAKFDARDFRKATRKRVVEYLEDEEQGDFGDDFDNSDAESLLSDLEDDAAAGGDHELPEHYAHWVNSLGHACIERVSVSLAGVLAQMLTGRFMNAWAELTGQVGKEQDDLIGTYATRKELIEASAQDQRLYIQVPFSFTRFTGRALPLLSMRFHGCTISLALVPLQRLIQVSGPNVTVIKTGDGQKISNSDVHAHLDVTNVFLDLQERKRFATGCFNMIWEQVQTYVAPSKGATIRAPLSMNHPSRCLIFMVQRKEVAEQNDTFDYSGVDPDSDPVEFAQLVVNTTPRFAREGSYFRKVVPYTSFPRVLKRGRWIYAMSFGLNAATEHTNGTLNFSRVDSCQLLLDLHPDMADQHVHLHVYNFTVNIVEFKKGLVNVAYQ